MERKKRSEDDEDTKIDYTSFLGAGKYRVQTFTINMMDNVYLENEDWSRPRQKKLTTIGRRKAKWHRWSIYKANHGLDSCPRSRRCKWGPSRHSRRKDASEEEGRGCIYYDYSDKKAGGIFFIGNQITY